MNGSHKRARIIAEMVMDKLVADPHGVTVSISASTSPSTSVSVSPSLMPSQLYKLIELSPVDATARDRVVKLFGLNDP